MPLQSFQNTFAGNPLDRASERRSDASWLARQLASPDALACALWNGRPLVQGADDRRQIAYLEAPLARELAHHGEGLLFMGLWGRTPIFAVDVEGSADPAQGPLIGRGAFEDLRAIALKLPAADAAILATAKSMFEWRARHRRCAVCGEPTRPVDGGWKRECKSCASEHFPRTDPVVIMLPHYRGRCLLGRQASWPEGMFSALAGFMEPGESIEEACGRELLEEAGLKAVHVRYHSSQPWPYPSSLMIGLIAELENDQAVANQTELSEVRWFTRAEARVLLEGGLEGLSAPKPSAIAHQLIKSWAYEAA